MQTMIRRPAAWLPIVVAMATWVFVLGYALAFGVQPASQPHDEAAPARIFQLLLLFQGLLILVFAARWLPRQPRSAALILLAQIASAALPIVTILFLES